MSKHFSGSSKKTVAKLIILEEYLDIYTKILENNWSAGLWYVDTHAGTGRTAINETTTVDGSAIRAIEQYGEQFEGFYFYELNPDHFTKLHETLSDRFGFEFDVYPTEIPGEDFTVARCDPANIIILQADSNEGVQFLAENSDEDRHWFTFIDPKGLTAKKATLDRLLERGNMDVLINYQTSGILRAAAEGAEHAHDAVTSQLGDEDWPNAGTSKEYVAEYEDRLGDGTDYDTVSSSMVPPNGDERYRFDLVFASANGTAVDLMEDRMQQDSLWEKVEQEINPGQSGLDDF